MCILPSYSNSSSPTRSCLHPPEEEEEDKESASHRTNVDALLATIRYSVVGLFCLYSRSLLPLTSFSYCADFWERCDKAYYSTTALD